MKTADNIRIADSVSFQDVNLVHKVSAHDPATAFPRKLLVPPAYEVLPDGSVKFRLFYPNAKRVSVKWMAQTCAWLELEKEGDLWSGVTAPLEGFIALEIQVDGNRVLNERLPIGFYGNRPANFIEIMEETSVIRPRTEIHGHVAMCYMNSRISGRMERIYVYLPAGYMAGTTRYPTLYLQHGFGENETVWISEGKLNFIFDNLIAEGKATPAIVVMCNGMLTFEQKDEILLGKLGTFEKMLVGEVIPYVDSHFRTIDDREHRVMAGLSMGSLQTAYITLKHQELFSGAGLFSGFFQNFLTDEQDHLVPELLRAYRSNMQPFFRAMGDCDEYLPRFLADDEMLERWGISSERRIYHGAHEWKVWQRCFYDFIQLIFKEG